MVREGDGWKTRCSFDYPIPFQVKFLSQSARCGSRQTVGEIYLRFRSDLLAQQYAHATKFHTYAPSILSSFCHASKFLCAPITSRIALTVDRFVKNICIHGTRFLPTILIIAGATKTRKEFRESREIDTYTVRSWEICTHGGIACIP